MTRISRQKLLDLYRNLPKDILEVYEGANTGEIVVDIGRKHGLLIDAVGRLSYEIGLVLVGAAPAHEFIDNVKTALGIPREKAVEIARDINARIFSTIRESLKRLHGVPTTKELIQENPEIKVPIAKPAAAVALAQAPKLQTAPTTAVPSAPRSPTAPSVPTPQIPKPLAPRPATPAPRVTVTPSAPVAPITQPKPITVPYPAAPVGAASGQTYWRVLDTLKKDVPPAPPAASTPPRAEPAMNSRVPSVTPPIKGLDISQNASIQSSPPSGLKTEASLSNGVNHEIEENKKGLLARIEQKEGERALGLRIKPAPTQPPKTALKNLMENEVGSILGVGTPVKPIEKSAADSKALKPTPPMANGYQVRPAPPPVPPPNLPTTPTSPPPNPPVAVQAAKTTPAIQQPPKNNLGMSPRQPSVDPYREPVDG